MNIIQRVIAAFEELLKSNVSGHADDPGPEGDPGEAGQDVVTDLSSVANPASPIHMLMQQQNLL